MKRKRATFDAEESSEVSPSVEHPGVRLRREVETEDMEVEQDPTPVGVGGTCDSGWCKHCPRCFRY